MKAELAERILTEIMGWTDSGQIHKELEDIQIIAELKYDDYQQFTHGQRYIEKLSLWLRNFETDEEKELIYNFIKDNLIFISEEEMRQLVSVSFEMFMKKFLIKKTKLYCDKKGILEETQRKKIWRYYRRSAMFLGLSDGSHMDYFRRHNKWLSNEQVFVHYDLSPKKAEDMLNDLERSPDYRALKKMAISEMDCRFKTFFLQDDFSGSGISYIRYDQEAEKWKGKIVKFIEQLEEMEWLQEDVDIHVILYVATTKALNVIKEQIESYIGQRGLNIEITVQAVQIVETVELNDQLYQLLKKNYESQKKIQEEYGIADYVDEHFRKGNYEFPFLGFDGCSLALVLYHNTPNNTFPVIWYSGLDDWALFPRISRHKEE